MTVQNSTTTLVGAQASVTTITIYPQADGSYVCTVTGSTKDTLNNVQQLKPVTASFPAGTAVLDQVTTAALSKLRIGNGLEV